MDDEARRKRLEEIQQKAAELKLKVFEDECHRLDVETEQGAKARLQHFKTKLNEHLRQQMALAAEERKRAEETILHHSQELAKQFDAEARKKADERAREEAERRRKAEEEERLRREEEARARAEEERRRREEEIKRAEEERRRRAEEERQRRENERLQIELERQRRDEEQRQQEQQRQERIRTLLTNAQEFYNTGDYTAALVEVAKALVNDPQHTEALELEAKIKQAQGKETTPSEITETDGEQTGEEKPTEETLAAQQAAQPAEKVAPRRKIRIPIVVAVFVVVVVLVLIIVPHLRQTAIPKNATFAVVPWITSSDEPGNEFLGPALAGEVASRFERYRPGITLGYGSVVSLWRRNPLPENAIFGLGYTFVLRGIVTRTGESATASVRLIDSDENVVWSHNFESPIAQLPQLPGEIADVVAHALNAAPENASISSPPLLPASSYLSYLQANELLRHCTQENVRTAHTILQKLVQQEPEFSDALSTLANVLLIEKDEGWSESDQATQDASRLAQQALSLDPNSAKAYYALGRSRALDGKYSSAIASFDSAAERNPNDPSISCAEGFVYLRTARYAEALSALSRAYSMDARNSAVLHMIGNAYALLRMPDKGILYHELALEVVDDSTDYLAGPFATLVLNDPHLRLSYNSRISSAYERLMLRDPNDYISAYDLGRLKQIMGTEDADSVLRSAEDRLHSGVNTNPRNAQMMTYLALTKTRLGKFNQAINLTQRAIAMEPRNAAIWYNAARVYAMQMYSHKTNEFDTAKTKQAFASFKQAIALRYNLDDIIDPDYYNMIEQPEYRALVRDVYR